MRYLPDNRKIGKSEVKPLYKTLETMLKKIAYKHVKHVHAILTLLNLEQKYARS